MGLPRLRDSLCNVSTLTHILLQNSRRSERSGRPARRKRRISERPKRSEPELLLFPPMVKALPTMALPLATSKEAGRSNSLLSATNPALKSLASTKLHPAAFNNCKSTATTTSRTLAIQHRRMAHQTRCIANVITPSAPSPYRAMLTPWVDNGGPAPKYEH
jgi:hypothetical protein